LACLRTTCHRRVAARPKSVLQFASVHSVEFIKMVELAVTVRVPHVCLEMAVADDVGAVKGHWMVSALSCRILINIDS
jgi:hypothetical protein